MINQMIIKNKSNLSLHKIGAGKGFDLLSLKDKLLNVFDDLSARDLADHGGFKMKEQLKAFLTDFGLNVRDFGTNSEDAVDYPDLWRGPGRLGR